MSDVPEPFPAEEAGKGADQHASLKRHLLGPSSGKAGLKGNDKVSEIIYEASKGSKYFLREEARDRELTKRIAGLLQKKEALLNSPENAPVLDRHLRNVDDHLFRGELSRDISQTIVHIDCDAFYAAVEELDQPRLKEIPFAVGGGVVSTANYVARSYGVRSGMAEFIAKKVCPKLTVLPVNMQKYTAKAAQIRAILAEYDPNFESASIDEAYLNLTDYLARYNGRMGATAADDGHGSDDSEQQPLPTREKQAAEVVQEIRDSILARTHISVSAGIGPNTLLAKVGSDRNKPAGQFEVPRATPADVTAFAHTLPIRKLFGIGRVTERELEGVFGIKTVGDVYEHRALLVPLVGEKTTAFLLDAYLGLGRTVLAPTGSYERKSLGTERTFKPTGSMADLRDRLLSAARELEQECRKQSVRGHTLTLKLKLDTFELVSRQLQLPVTTTKAADFYKFALPMLEKVGAQARERNEGFSVRLLGLRLNKVVEGARVGPMDAFVHRRPSPKTEEG